MAIDVRNKASALADISERLMPVVKNPTWDIYKHMKENASMPYATAIHTWGESPEHLRALESLLRAEWIDVVGGRIVRADKFPFRFH
jgi:hypothetical protein